MKEKGGSQNKSDGVSGQSLHKTNLFVYFHVLFFGIFSYFYTSAQWIIQLMMNIMIKLLLFLSKSKRFWSVIVGEGWRMGSVGVIMQRCSFREFALLFKPIDTQTTFGIKLFKQSGSDTCLCFYEQVFLHNSFHLI